MEQSDQSLVKQEEDAGQAFAEEFEELEETEEPDPNPEPVSYTGTDFDVEGLVRRLDRGDIVIPTYGVEADESEDIETRRFQRQFVWRRPQMDRFIESLLLGYPIPGIFLVQQVDRRYLVLDGQQRLKTLSAFYNGVHANKVFELAAVGERFKGLTYSKLTAEQKRTLDNTFIQATIVRTDDSADSLDAVYQVFERLNSGGTQLTSHEIRVALYAGPFVELIQELNALDPWRTLYGKLQARLRDQELVLRILALYVSPGTYKRPLKKFLNDFTAQHRNLEALNVQGLRQRFGAAATLLSSGPGPQALRLGKGQVNAALTEAIFVGLMRRLDAGPPPAAESLDTPLRQMLEDTGFLSAVSRATADEESVRTRLAVATQAFSVI
jgi:Protein of unknown function DUF262